MATRGAIKVVGMTTDGNYIVKPLCPGTAQLMRRAANGPNLEVRDVEPRRRGGRPYPALRLAQAPNDTAKGRP